MNKHFYSTAGLAAMIAALTGPAVAGEMQVTVQSIAHDKGGVRIAIYSGAETFRKEDRAVLVRTLPAKPGEAVETIAGLAAGRYAVIVYHDENGNGEMDRWLGMIPTEGYGLSNNPDVSGPPRFEECAFDVSDSAPTRTEIRLRY